MTATNCLSDGDQVGDTHGLNQTGELTFDHSTQNWQHMINQQCDTVPNPTQDVNIHA